MGGGVAPGAGQPAEVAAANPVPGQKGQLPSFQFLAEPSPAPAATSSASPSLGDRAAGSVPVLGPDGEPLPSSPPSRDFALRQGNVVLPDAAKGVVAAPVVNLDSDKGRKEVVGFYELQNADPQDVYNKLQDLFQRNNVRQQNNNLNPNLGQNSPLYKRAQNNTQTMSSGTTSGFGGSSSRSGSPGGF